MCMLAHNLLLAAHPQAAQGLEVRLAYAGALRTLHNGLTVAGSTITSWRRLAAQRARYGQRMAPLGQALSDKSDLFGPGMASQS